MGLDLSIFDDRPDLVDLYYSRADCMDDTRDTLRVLVEHGRAEVGQPVGQLIQGLCTDTALHWFDGSVDDFSWLSTEDKITLVGNDLQEFYASVAINQGFLGELQSTQATMNRLTDLGQVATASVEDLTILDGLLRILVFCPLVLEEKRDLFEILRRLLDAGMDIHGSNLARHTPLMGCALFSLEDYIRYHVVGALDSHCWSFESVATYCTERLKDWAEFLKQSGQDLHEYVKMEKEHGINEWEPCSTWGLSRNDDEYFTSLKVRAKVFLWVNTKEERLEIRLVYATKRRHNSVPGGWVDEQSQESSLEDDEGWTYHYPDVGEDVSDFDYSEEEEEEICSSCEDDEESYDDDDEAENPEIEDEVVKKP
jgi:hypothetical protein